MSFHACQEPYLAMKARTLTLTKPAVQAMTLTLLEIWSWTNVNKCTNRDSGCGPAQSLVCE